VLGGDPLFAAAEASLIAARFKFLQDVLHETTPRSSGQP
jgi:hypothetical protein